MVPVLALCGDAAQRLHQSPSDPVAEEDLRAALVSQRGAALVGRTAGPTAGARSQLAWEHWHTSVPWLTAIQGKGRQ